MTVKRMYRSRSDVMLGGVCSGLAKYLDVDSTLVRLSFLLLLFVGMGGLWIYLIMWVIMPLEPKEDIIKIVDAKPILVDRSVELEKGEKKAVEIKKLDVKKAGPAKAVNKVASPATKPATTTKKPDQKSPGKENPK